MTSKTPEQLTEDYKALPESDKEHISQVVETRKTQLNKINRPQSKSVLADLDELNSDEDKAERYSLVEVIADQILKSTHISTFSLNGPWGSGKTVMMKWLKNVFDQKYQGEIISISFEAWKYESVGNLTYAMISKLKSLNPSSDVRTKIDNVLIKVVPLTAWTPMIGEYLGFKVIGLAYSALKAYTKIRKLLNTETENIDQLRNQFQELVTSILEQHNNPPAKIVFLIDDLDRCSPDNVVKLLESIKNFLGVERTAFILAIDRDVIAQGVSLKYGNLSKIDGDEYLEKIIQFSYELPFESKTVASNILQEYQMNFDLHFDLEFAPTLISLSNIKSIRAIKRIFNRYFLIHERAFRKHQGKLNPQVLFLVIFLYEVYPKLYFLIKDNKPQTLLEQITSLPLVDFEPQRIRRHSQTVQKLIELLDRTEAREVVAHFVNISKEWTIKERVSEEYFKCIDMISEFGV